MYIEIPLGIMYIACSSTMYGHKAQEVLPTQYISCMAASCVIFFINLNLTLRAIAIFNKAVEDVSPNASISFHEVNKLPFKNVETKCKSIPFLIFHLLITLTILISLNNAILIPENCLIDSVNENKEPVCLLCDEYFDINSTNLCELGKCGLESNVLRRDFSNFPMENEI
jgi:hypothetical protein